jgi:hypothetical protein
MCFRRHWKRLLLLIVALGIVTIILTPQRVLGMLICGCPMAIMVNTLICIMMGLIGVRYEDSKWYRRNCGDPSDTIPSPN